MNYIWNLEPISDTEGLMLGMGKKNTNVFLCHKKKISNYDEMSDELKVALTFLLPNDTHVICPSFNYQT